MHVLPSSAMRCGRVGVYTMSNAKLSPKQLRDLVGDPGEVDKSLREFRESAAVLSADSPRMIEKYPNQWVALYHGKVAASAATFDELISAVSRNHLPREDVLVRLIETRQRVLIL